METYDFELMENTQLDATVITRNASKILISKMRKTGAYYYEYPYPPAFYAIQTRFYPNGRIRSKIKYIGEKLGIGESIYYDEEGKIINRVNEDAKFGKVKAEDLLKFIEKEGWINLETGEGIENIEILEDGLYRKNSSHFTILEMTNPNGTKFWKIEIQAMPYNDFYKTIYHLDKETGEVLYKKTEKINYIK